MIVLHLKEFSATNSGPDLRKCTECGVRIWAVTDGPWTNSRSTWEHPPFGYVNCASEEAKAHKGAKLVTLREAAPVAPPEPEPVRMVVRAAVRKVNTGSWSVQLDGNPRVSYLCCESEAKETAVHASLHQVASLVGKGLVDVSRGLEVRVVLHDGTVAPVCQKCSGSGLCSAGEQEYTCRACLGTGKEPA